MEDFKIAMPAQDEQTPRFVKLPPFTLIGSTTDFGKLLEPMRARFGQTFHLQLYSEDELVQVISRAATKLGYFTNEESEVAIAKRSRGTPRVALRLLRRCVDVAIAEGEDFIDEDLVEATMPLLGLDELGLEIADRQYLTTLVEVFGGGPAGIDALTTNANLDAATAKKVVEPVLQLKGLIARTRKGRRITRRGYDHYKDFVMNAKSVNWQKVER